MADIERILKKKKWTGRELGILEVTNMALIFRQNLEGEKAIKPIIDRPTLSDMVNTLVDLQQRQIYMGYISIHEWISFHYSSAQSHMQQAQFQMHILTVYINDAKFAEDIYIYTEQLPAIMTQKQYNEYNKKDNDRASLNGIAILQSDSNANIDNNGCYVEPDIRPTLSEFTLGIFFPDSENYDENLKIVESARECLFTSCYYLKGYNYALEIIGRDFDVPDIEIFKMEVSIVEDMINGFNNLVDALRKKIRDANYADDNLKAQKLKVLDDLFKPIDYNAISIPEKNKRAVGKLLKNFTAFRPNEAKRFERLLLVPNYTEEATNG
uniref:Uncharacterized protein n=1 Tax=uncultured prokaryote TaxID=198431 RepID=A0A0H5PXU0_9ZZZZ|nr:hypothetical protein [uncultured prokaryote]